MPMTHADYWAAHESAHADVLKACPGSTWPRLLETMPGWFPAIVTFARRVNHSGLAIDVSTVKTKMGGLRIYYEVRPGGGHHPRIDALVDAAEDACSERCEYCGGWADHADGEPWVRLLCKPCKRKQGPKAAMFTHMEKPCET